MKLRIILLSVLLITIESENLQAQNGQSALPFLLLPSSAEMTGMGYTSAALPSDDPFVSMYNPAHLGIQSLKNYFSFGYNYCDWLPGYHIKNLGLTSFALTGGINLNKYYSKLPSLSVGLGYSQLLFDYGELMFDGNQNKAESYDKSDQLTLSLGFDSYIRASVGVTYKHVYSRLAGNFTVGNISGEAKTTADLFDWGAYIELPVISLFSKSLDQPIDIYDGLSPVLNCSFAFSKGNLGQNTVYYVSPAQSDPLPRIARAGLGFTAGLQYVSEDITWTPLAFKWTAEANDNLVRTSTWNNQPEWEYQSGFGDIDFLDEIIFGRTNQLTEKLKGWELNIFEMLSFYGGRLEGNFESHDRKFNTSGWSIRTAGLVKLLRISNSEFFDDSILGYILTHTDLRYSLSTIKTEDNKSPMNDTDQISFNIILSN